ncbi:TPR-like protein [Pholiota conissans]|uniref:TPR-like protein n=1 Tax=Pholiota conissans TaxID=109636 RepID=A0A9P5YLK3_9AGAR|nr:TPR-like protein [Pholiota conissans]
MLSPIRLFCQHFLAQETVDALPKTVNHYLDILLAAGYNPGNSVNYHTITPEVRNIHNIFQKLFLGEIQNHDLSKLIEALWCLTNWSIYIGYYSKDTVQAALIKTQHIPITHALCIFSIAQLYYADADYTHVVKHFQEAANLCQQTKEITLQAYALQCLGETLRTMDELDKAENALKTSLNIYMAENIIQGQANVHYGLGVTYLDMGRLQEAEIYLTKALEVYKQIPDLIEQANTMDILAQIHLLYRNPIKAEEFANKALEIAKKTNYAAGKRNALQSLGQIYLRMDRFTDACQALEKALSIFKHQKDLTNQLSVAGNLGEIYIQLDQLSTAETLLEPYSQMDSDTIHSGNVLTTFGWLYTCGDHFDKAECHLNAALQLYQKFKSLWGQANVLTHLGVMYLKSGQFNKAEQVVKSIPNLSMKKWRNVEIRRLWVLGDHYIIKGQFGNAQAMLNSAMVQAKNDNSANLCQQTKEITLQAYALQCLGETLHMMHELDKAENALKTSLKIYMAENITQGQANAHYGLGLIYVDMGQLQEAEIYLTKALEVYKQIPDLIEQANTMGVLAHIHLLYRNPIKAEEFANQALEFAKKANYATGKGIALQMLGQIYLQMDRIMDACQALEKALSIFKHLKDLTNQRLVVGNLGEVYIQLDQLSAAETLLEPYSQMDSNTIYSGHVLTTLGWLYTCGNHLDKAEHHLNAALQLYQKLKDQGGQANVLAHFGIMYLKSGQFDKAEQVVKSIPNLSMDKWRKVEMLRLWALGDLYIIKGQFGNAQAALNSAMVQAKSDNCSYQQGNIICSLGTLHIKRGRVDRAIRAYKRALTFHRAAQWISEQATDLMRLGEVYEMLGRSEEAAAAFKEADELMESVREARQLSE